MRPKYIAGPINSLLKARFMPHMGKRDPCRAQVLREELLNKAAEAGMCCVLLARHHNALNIMKSIQKLCRMEPLAALKESCRWVKCKLTLGMVKTASTYRSFLSLGLTIWVGAS